MLRIGRPLLLSALGAGALILAPLAVLPAHGALVNQYCESGEICLYENTSYGGGRFQRDEVDSTYSNNVWYNTSDGMNDETSSLKNHRSCRVELYQHANYDGNTYRLEQYGLPYDRATSLGSMDNMLSSNRLCI